MNVLGHAAQRLRELAEELSLWSRTEIKLPRNEDISLGTALEHLRAAVGTTGLISISLEVDQYTGDDAPKVQWTAYADGKRASLSRLTDAVNEVLDLLARGDVDHLDEAESALKPEEPLPY